MKYLISLLSWSFGLLSALILLPALIISTFFLGPKGISLAGKIVMRSITACFLVRVRREGREKVDPRLSHLYMANHASFFDFFILAGYLPGNTRGLEAAEHFSWPLWGAVLRRIGIIPIDRSNPRASLASINLAAERLRNGYSILILPEGTRTRDGRMLPFKKLPFKLAKKGGTDIVPVGLTGTFGIKRKTSWLLRPGKVIMRFGDAIPAEVIREKGMEELMEIARDRIAGLVGEES